MRGLAAFGLTVFLAAAWPAAGRAQIVFPIDQRYGTIDFSVDHLGLFTSHGDFRRFSGTLAIDTERPERTMVKVMIDARSVEMDSQDGLTMVRSADYFDVDGYPVITFQSTAVAQTSPDHYRIAGEIKIRNVTRPIVLDAVLTGHPRGPTGPMSEFVIDGKLNRGDFGMIANQNFVSDMVQIHITERIALDHVPPIGGKQAATAPNAG